MSKVSDRDAHLPKWARVVGLNNVYYVTGAITGGVTLAALHEGNTALWLATLALGQSVATAVSVWERGRLLKAGGLIPATAGQPTSGDVAKIAAALRSSQDRLERELSRARIERDLRDTPQPDVDRHEAFPDLPQSDGPR